MHVTRVALVKTATDLKHLQRGAELVKDASDMTSGLKDLTSLHMLAEDANDAMAKFMAAIDPPDASGGHKAVEGAAGEEGRT